MTASFSPNPTTGDSTLTFTASTSASVGQSVVTITGTSGALSATTTINLGVYAPSFTLYGGSPKPQSRSGHYGKHIRLCQPQYGFTGSVTLSVSGLAERRDRALDAEPNDQQQHSGPRGEQLCQSGAVQPDDHWRFRKPDSDNYSHAQRLCAELHGVELLHRQHRSRYVGNRLCLRKSAVWLYRQREPCCDRSAQRCHRLVLAESQLPELAR